MKLIKIEICVKILFIQNLKKKELIRKIRNYEIHILNLNFNSQWFLINYFVKMK